VTERRSVLDNLKARGEEFFGRVSGELMSNPHFMKALQAAIQGKELFDKGAARALKQMNIPTRTEFKRALHRIEALEQELAALKAKAKAPVRRKKAARRKPQPKAAASAETVSRAE
jgi:polyhydroxyalkanoate synthesis regulator phasin